MALVVGDISAQGVGGIIQRVLPGLVVGNQITTPIFANNLGWYNLGWYKFMSKTTSLAPSMLLGPKEKPNNPKNH
jgi:hypothetical protein